LKEKIKALGSMKLLNAFSLNVRIILLFSVIFFLTSCGGNDNGQKKENIKQKLPFKVDAPWGANYETREYNEVTSYIISKDDEYAVEVIATPAGSEDIATIKNEQLNTVTESPYFSRLILNEPNGFIFEMVVDSSKHYDFRLVKLRDNTQYVFQTELTRVFSEWEARSMYESVK